MQETVDSTSISAFLFVDSCVNHELVKHRVEREKEGVEIRCVSALLRENPVNFVTYKHEIPAVKTVLIENTIVLPM